MSGEAQYLDVVEHLYGAAIDERQWSPVLDEIGDLFGAVGVSLEIIDKKSSRPISVNLGSRLNIDGATEEYLRHYGAISPRVRQNTLFPNCSITCDYDFITEQEMDEDEFYTDFGTLYGLRYFISGQVLNTAGYNAIIAPQRSPAQGHVDRHEIELMERLLPHVRQAMDIKFRLARVQREGRLALECLEILDEGCLLIDQAGKLLYSNPRAGEIFFMGDGIDVVGGFLSFPDQRAATCYGRALTALAPEEGRRINLDERNFPARRPSGRRPYLIAVRYLPGGTEFALCHGQAAAIVFIRDPSRFVRLDKDLLRRSYGLSIEETRLAAALERGLSTGEVARRRGVSVTTVRSQLYSLMNKMSVRRQNDLIRLLGRYCLPFR